MSTTLAGKLKAAPFMDASRYGRSDRSAVGRWFWEIDRVLLLLVTVGVALLATTVLSALGGSGVGALGVGVKFLVLVVSVAVNAAAFVVVERLQP